MSITSIPVVPKPMETEPIPPALLRRYGCGPVQFTGSDTALCERHLLFDNVISITQAGPRQWFEAFVRSVRHVLAQRWLLTDRTYERKNPERMNYLSMEFLIGRWINGPGPGSTTRRER